MASGAPQTAADAGYRFGPYTLDAASYELRRDGIRVRLERRPLDLLLLLVARRGQLVSHADIAHRLWGDDVFVEVEAGIHTAVRKARQALGDSAEAPIYIESVPGRGYRFAAPVEPVSWPRVAVPTASPGQPPTPAATAVSPVPSPDAAATARWRVAAVPALLVAVVATATWSLGFSDPRPSPVVVGVLPFAAPDGTAALNETAAGLAEEISVSLGQVDPEHLRVVGRGTMLRYQPEARPPDEVGRAVGATHLVEGTVRAEDGRVRVTVSLVRTDDRTQAWSASFDGARSNLLGLQGDISRAVTRQIRLRLSSLRLRPGSRRHTQHPLAYDAYLQGRGFWSLRAREPNARAVEMLTQAISLDPAYALAWAALSQVHAASLLNGDGRPADVRQPALDAAARAIAAAPDLAEAVFAEAFCAWVVTWDWEQAEQGMRRAHALDPQHVDAVRTLGHVLSQRGNHDEAASFTQQAREMDPMDPLVHALSGQVAFQGGRFTESLAHAERALALAPGFWVGHMIHGQALERLGRLDDAAAALAQAERLSDRNAKAVATRAFTLARLGRTSEATSILEALAAAARQRYVPPYAFALVHLGLGDDDRALEWLTRAYESRDVHLMYVPVDAKWQHLRDDPRLVALLRRSGFRP